MHDELRLLLLGGPKLRLRLRHIWLRLRLRLRLICPARAPLLRRLTVGTIRACWRNRPQSLSTLRSAQADWAAR